MYQLMPNNFKYSQCPIRLSFLHHGVVWHTGKVLAGGAVGRRFKSRQGRGFCGAYSVLCQAGALHQWPGGLVWFTDSIPALVGFLRVLRFLPAPKNRNHSIFLVHSFWFLVVCVQSLLGCLVFNYLCVRCGYHTTASREPCGLISRTLQKLLITVIIHYYHTWRYYYVTQQINT